MEIAQYIQEGKAVLGIEFGSTRIKAVLIGEQGEPLASGSHNWENRLEDGVWTYHEEDIWNGLADCYRSLAEQVQQKYQVTITKLAAIGFSAMMHGYLAFDAKGDFLVPFRTWRNTMTEEAAEQLTERFAFNIPQRWSAFISGNFERGTTFIEAFLFYDIGGLCTLEAHRRKSTRRGRCIGNVPDRQRDGRLR